ncbi:phosphate ABC transporter permease subunit PstC [Acetomicrobium sp. S15 = DSM 107314]|uniref:phosphate ABC transporter permease subunit PstC n=1 Tax=Acetomicrobium sp. S15 = DSM 107314 TaxID=2529858 RepID=UPI001E5A917B|nr:phosphate ABC transporter permease subunit PstC [Acetomicrobium sp. S15 = DSM 107314]
MPTEGAMRGDRVPQAAITIVAAVGLLILIFILVFLVRESIPILKITSLKDLLFGIYWYPTYNPPDFGMLPLIIGSIAVTLLASVLAIPLSLGLAIFLSEVCPRTLREFFKPTLEVLGFLPSVVLGFVGMVLLAPWLQMNLNILSGLNMFNASVLMGIMIVPIVASIAEDSFRAVPQDLRDAAYALGSTRLETIIHVLFPAALPGIVEACLLGIMRAVGETMVVLMAAGGAAVIPRSIFDPVRPLTSAIAAEMGEAPVGSPHYHALFFAGLLLLIMTLAINLTALWVERRWRWNA